MSEPEAEAVETVGTEELPAIGAARLEAMFDGLRREVVLAVPVPPSAEMVRRGVRRARYRAGAVAVAGVLGVAVLWSAATVLPLSAGRGHGMAAYPVPPTAGATGPDVALPWPEPRFPLLPSVGGVVEWPPLEWADAEARALVLDVSRMPSVLGSYGPWTAVSVMDETSAGPSASASLGLSPTAAPANSPTNSTSTSSPDSPDRLAGGASPFADSTGPTRGTPDSPAAAGGTGSAGPDGYGDGFADGCVSRLIRTSGAELLWGQRYIDPVHPEASAQQVVMRFGSPAAAGQQATRLMRGGECVSAGNWRVEQQVGAVVALGVRQPVVFAEELVVHVSGTSVAVLTVRRGGRGVSPAAGLSDPFRAAAQEFLQLRATG